MDRHDGSHPEGSRPAASEEGRGDYLGFVAHEVRNPLSTALWSAELLARMAPEERAGARGEKLTQMCLRSLGRVRQLVEDHFLCERLDVNGIPTRAMEVSKDGGRLRVWVDAQGLLVKFTATGPDGATKTVLEVKSLAVGKPPAARLALLPACAK